ncbi:hypothetical protein AB3U99_01925 [Niallia sp. JL1B1071]
MNNHKMDSLDIEELKANMKNLNGKIHQMLTTVDIQDQHKKRD